MKTFKVFCIFAGMILLITGALFAQTQLQFGSSASGMLDSGQEIWYSVRTSENGFAVFEIMSNFDSYLEAYDVQYNQIAYDDDSGDGVDARLELYVTAGTTYLIKVRGFSSSHSGSYRLFAGINPAPVPVQLNLGSIRSANLSENGADWYSVRATQVGFLTVEGIGGTVSYVDLYDSNFVFLQTAYYNEYTDNAKMEFLTEANKTYNIRVRGNPRGSYRILASINIPVPVELSIGSQRSGNLSAGGALWYSVRPAQAGPLVIQTFNSSDNYIDTYLDVYSTSYELLASDDDSGGDGQAKVVIFAEANRTYLIRMRGYSDSYSGPFQIRAAMETVSALQLGVPATVTFNLPYETKWYRYVASGNNSFVEFFTRGNLDTTLTLYDSQGNHVAYDDDSGDGLNARIVERLSAGTYFIEVRRYSDDPGSCTLHAVN